MNVIYDDETQVALNELDRNITARTKYLAVNTFGCKPIANMLRDDVLTHLFKIKREVIATATIKTVEYDEMNEFHGEPLTIPRTQCHANHAIINEQHLKEESE